MAKTQPVLQPCAAEVWPQWQKLPGPGHSAGKLLANDLHITTNCTVFFSDMVAIKIAEKEVLYCQPCTDLVCCNHCIY